MSPGLYDFTTIQGNTLPIRLRLTDFDATGSQFVFRSLGVNPAAALRKSTADNAILVRVETDLDDPAKTSSTITLCLSAAETRALEPGHVTRYELERRINDAQTTILAGYIDVAEGINDDV